MAIPVYMDVHVSQAITVGLRRRGINVLTSQEDGTTRFSDAELLDRASALERVFFSQDDDLLRLAASRQRSGEKFAGVIYAHQLSAGIGPLIDDLHVVLDCCSADELTNRVVYLPLR